MIKTMGCNSAGYLDLQNSILLLLVQRPERMLFFASPTCWYDQSAWEDSPVRKDTIFPQQHAGVKRPGHSTLGLKDAALHMHMSK